MAVAMIAAKPSVLLVEDEMLVAISIEDALLEDGYDVAAHASTVKRALELLKERPFDVALLDMNLNGQSGLPVAGALAEKGIPFLVLSGYGAAALAGTQHRVPVIAKPFDPANLTATIRELLERTSGEPPED